MITPGTDHDCHGQVGKAVAILAAAIGPVVAEQVVAKGFGRYRAGDGGDRSLATLAATADTSEVLKAMLDYWGEVFQPYFGHPEHLRVRQMVHNVRVIRNYYVGRHDSVACDYDPYDAIGEVARLLARFSAAEAVGQVNELKREVGRLMYGQAAAAQPGGGFGNGAAPAKEALAMPVADAISREAVGQWHGESGRAGSRRPDVGSAAHSAASRAAAPATASIAVPPADVGAPARDEKAVRAADARDDGNRAMEGGHIDRAIADFTVAIGLDPQDAVAYRDRGIAYARKREYERAVADFTVAIGLDPQDAVAYCNRGNAYDDIRDYDRAIADYNAAIGLNPQYAAAYNNRGNACRNKGEHNRAIDDYSVAISLNPQYAAAYYNRGNAYRNEGEYDRAVADFTAVIRLHPEDAAAYYNRGRACHNKGEYDRAIADFTAVIRLNPEDAAAYCGRGLAGLGRGEPRDAIRDFTRAIGIRPEYATAYHNRGVAQGIIGNRAQAEEDFARARELGFCP